MASKRRIRRKQCESHRAYSTFESALEQAKNLVHYTQQWNVRTYKCPFCGKWHVGHYHNEQTVTRFPDLSGGGRTYARRT